MIKSELVKKINAICDLITYRIENNLTRSDDESDEEDKIWELALL